MSGERISAAERAIGPPFNSCGNVKVYLRPFGVMWATCRDGVLVDTFLAGTPCPHHEADRG